MSITLYDLPALRDCFFCNLLVLGFVYFCVFVFGALGIALWQALNPHTWLPRIGKLGAFLIALLVAGDFFSFLWGTTIFDHVYYSADYAGIDFLPWLPISHLQIDRTFGNEHGALTGVTLWQLQLIWLAFAACSWVITIWLYRKILWFHQLCRKMMHYKGNAAKASNAGI